MNIRDVRETDLNAVAPLSCMVNKMHVDAYPDIYKITSVEAAIKILSPKINDGSSIFRLAFNEKDVLGYYLAEILYRDETDLIKASRYIYLAELIVSPEAQRSGVGRALLGDLKLIARGKNIDRIELDVSGFNEKARAFYGRQGFEKLRERMGARIGAELE